MKATATIQRETVAGVPDRLLDLDELCAYTGLKKSTVYYKTQHRQIPFTKIGQLLRFRLSEIDAWIEEQTVRPARGASR